MSTLNGSNGTHGVGLAGQPMSNGSVGLASGSDSSAVSNGSSGPRARARTRFSSSPSGSSPSVGENSADREDGKKLVLDSFADQLDLSHVAAPCVTLVAPGVDNGHLRRAVGSMGRFLAKLGAPALWFVITRETGAQAHVHGLVARDVSSRLLLEGWRSATKGCATLARTIDARPLDDRLGGLGGWLSYSARSLALSDLPTDVIAQGAWFANWSTALGLATVAPSPLCAWCLAPLTADQIKHGAEYHRRGCLELASRARAREGKRGATVANPSPAPAPTPTPTVGHGGQPPVTQPPKASTPTPTTPAQPCATPVVGVGVRRSLDEAARFAIDLEGIEASPSTLLACVRHELKSSGAEIPENRQIERALTRALVNA